MFGLDLKAFKLLTDFLFLIRELNLNVLLAFSFLLSKFLKGGLELFLGKQKLCALLSKQFLLGFNFLAQQKEVVLLLGEKLQDEATQRFRPLFKQAVHEVGQLLLVLVVDVVLSHLNCFIFVESSLDALSKNFGLFGVWKDIDLVTSLVTELLDDGGLLFLRNFVHQFFSALVTSLDSIL